MFLQPAQLSINLMEASKEKSSLHAERECMCILCHVSDLEQKTYLRMKFFFTERHMESLDNVHYGQNTKYTLTVKYSSIYNQSFQVFFVLNQAHH